MAVYSLKGTWIGCSVALLDDKRDHNKKIDKRSPTWDEVEKKMI